MEQPCFCCENSCHMHIVLYHLVCILQLCYSRCIGKGYRQAYHWPIYTEYPCVFGCYNIKDVVYIGLWSCLSCVLCSTNDDPPVILVENLHDLFIWVCCFVHEEYVDIRIQKWIGSRSRLCILEEGTCTWTLT